MATRLRCSTGSTPEDREHFAEVLALLRGAGVAYEIDPTLVRGLDYYTRTVFEFTSDALGAQSGIGGGGRYDGLVELLGGPPTPGIGWAAGVERILLALPAIRTASLRLRLISTSRTSTLALTRFSSSLEARAAGLQAQMELAGRSLKGQLQTCRALGRPLCRGNRARRNQAP